jgi:hypothetical protein
MIIPCGPWLRSVAARSNDIDLYTDIMMISDGKIFENIGNAQLNPKKETKQLCTTGHMRPLSIMGRQM